MGRIFRKYTQMDTAIQGQVRKSLETKIPNMLHVAQV